MAEQARTVRRRAVAALRALRSSERAPQLFPPGAFYSPVVDAALVTSDPDRRRVWPDEASDPAGIDLRPDAQLALLERLRDHQLPDPASWPQPAYDPANDQFPPQDAALLYALVRHLRPARVVEVGSGWSTTVTARAIADGGLGTKLTCIEPYPRDFLRHVEQVHELRQERMELTPMAVFDALGAGDVLFIDSSHVAKTGSDVVHQLLHVVPRLADGVVVHVHDIFIPEDYPQGWVRAGFNWNEQYLLQAYLSGNQDVRVLAANHWLALRHPDAVAEAFGPLPLSGSSFWFQIADRKGGRADRSDDAHGRRADRDDAIEQP